MTEKGTTIYSDRLPFILCYGLVSFDLVGYLGSGEGNTLFRGCVRLVEDIRLWADVIGLENVLSLIL